MTFQGLLLLPSQEALIQRLHHVASYSDQLLVLSGAQGSGKTTLVTALATDFEESNVALVICPMHADDAEIRRKILVQLMSSPIFDDEEPLAETLLRVAATQTKPLHIIIDDAHLLSKTLWAECIILNQIQCAGKNIALTLTVPPAFLADLLPQLPEALRRQVLPIAVEPLTLVEREALYQTLLRTSEQHPFTPREIVRGQLEKQMGTPQEVVSLLALALHDQPEQVTWWRKHRVGIIAVVSVLFALLLGIVLHRPRAPELSEPVTYPAVDSKVFLAYGHRALAEYFEWRAALLRQSQVAPVSADPLAAFHGEPVQSAEPSVVTALSTQDAEAAMAGAAGAGKEAAAQVDVTTSAEISDVAVAADKVAPEPNQTTPASQSQEKATGLKPATGYTVQIASVSQRRTLDSLLQSLTGVENVRLAKHKRYWVVLVGQYDTASGAQKAAAQLVKDYRIDKPWVRKWSELGGYQLQEALPHREISE
ncbi:MAG: AAA family ATPase [Shewanella sp.]|uniref:AAA family ATPase n=1 Tax=Shewanella sp. TaxID=50422 RepID=UPI003F2FE2E0